MRWLAGSWDGARALDLSRVLVMVPTRQSGRRLREALANHAAAHGQAAFPPRVLTPDALAAQETGPNVASRLDTLLAWTEMFRALDLEAFRAIFPRDPPVRNFSWALQLALQFGRLQGRLAENGLLLADVGAKMGEGFVEAARWAQIAALERLHAEHLARRGLRAPEAARIDAARRGLPAGDYSRIVLLAVPDPQPLALARLGIVAGQNPIEIAIFAPESEAAAFDAWGRPLAAEWERRVLDFPEFENRVHLCADPAAQATRLTALAAGYTAPDGVLGLGVADPEITPLLENELARGDRPSFRPEGEPYTREALFELLSCLAALAREPLFAHVAALARCPDFLAYLRAQPGAPFSPAHWLAQLDALWARHLPADLAAARAAASASPERFGVAARGLETMENLRRDLGRGTFAETVAAALREIFSARQLDLSREADARLHAGAGAWMEVLREYAETEARFGALAPAEAWDLALRLFGERRRTEDKPAGALELQGWLELLWEDAPHLAVAGFNDGRVPEAVAEDAFLPESLRHRLGLQTNAARFARDAYLLQAMAKARAAHGRLDLFFGKTSAAGEPMRPSRLLLRCPDAELPARIAFLFRSPELAEANAAWTRAWKLSPRLVSAPPRVAVTALRRYLRCPFRFYLGTVLETETVDPAKSELDAFDFGKLCHTALERIGLEPALRNCTDAAALRAELLRQLDRAVQDRYGKNLSLPLLVQVESARQRVGKLAELQAAERAAGWEIIHTEWPFDLEIAGLGIRGRIDRIDRHAGTGAIRVLDYKTADAAVSPAQAHLRWLRAGDSAPEWAQCEFNGRPHAWTDLQLPLYLRALEEKRVAADTLWSVGCGYFNLPKAAGETALSLWEDYSPALQEAAMRCAEGACAAIRRGEFWPPNETIRPDWDEFAPLFHHGVAESVAWKGAVAPA